jgi:eight-cysteine-cluster-containing protein
LALGVCEPIPPESCGTDSITYCTCDNQTLQTVGCVRDRYKNLGQCTPPGFIRVPAWGHCVVNTNDYCASDADCVSAGCNGEVCDNPAIYQPIEDCSCSGPSTYVDGCGCVNNKCTWFEFQQ